MKKIAFLITYMAALVIGVLFLVFASAANVPIVPESIRGLIIATGIILIIPGFVSLIQSMKPRRDPNGLIRTLPWYITCVSILCLAWGIMLLCIPSLGDYLSITLGITLILAGFGQVIFIVQASRPYGASVAWYVIPICVFCAGIVDITLINDFADRGGSNFTAAIVSGISCIFWAVNGFLSLNYRRRQQHAVEDDVKMTNPRN